MIGEGKIKKETIVVASSNKGKIRKIKEIFKNYDVLSIKDMENRCLMNFKQKINLFLFFVI